MSGTTDTSSPGGTNLISPGVQVTIINETFYNTATPGTIPLIVIATAANKTAPNGTIAPYTAPAQIGQLYLATSQMDLTNNFGVPIFPSLQGTIQQGAETSEWGLLAAYSYLGVSNRCYVLRADIDLSQLVAAAVPPVGPPLTGQYWLNLATTTFGVFESNGNANPGAAWIGQTVRIPLVNQVDNNNVPLASFGSNGQYAIVPWTTSNLLYQKGVTAANATSQWYEVGTTGANSWQALFPSSVLGSSSPTPFTPGNNITIDGTVVTVTVGNTTLDLANAINSASIGAVAANVISNAINIHDPTGTAIVIANTGNIINYVGLTPGTYGGVTFNQTATNYYQYPSGVPAGSVWVKGNSSRSGANWVIEYFNGTVWTTLSAPLYRFNSILADGNAAKDAAALAAITNPTIGSVYIGFDTTYFVYQPRRWNGTNWASLSYVASSVAPTTAPAAETLWFDSSSSFVADIMVNNPDGNQWLGYINAYPATDPNGIQIGGSAPTTQSTGAPLVANDLWLDSSANSEDYPVLYIWNTTSQAWSLIDLADQTSPFGIIFADSRQNSGTTYIGIQANASYTFNSTATTDLLRSNFVDPDAPNPELYPGGMLLFNTRVSNNLMKIWYPTYFLPGPSPTNFDPNDNYTINSYTVGNTAIIFPPLASPARWVNAAGNNSADQNLPYFGRKAQRALVVQSLISTIETNQDIRSELVYFNLIATPGYCELIDTMSTLNVDQNLISFIIADTPIRLTPDSTSLLGWANNSANVGFTTEAGLAPGSYSGALGDYIALYYPWGLSTNLAGAEVMVPPSHIALSTIAYSDSISFPWFAPAGFTRGVVTNASSVGYLSSTGAFQPVILNQSQRDILYGFRPSGCQINPIAYIPGRGLVLYGQITLSGDSSELSRINVTRLCCYLTYQLDVLFKPFLFEQNDAITQSAATNTANAFLNGLVGNRAISDYAVLCDSTNNTPDRIAANELWVDVAIIPITAVEFIYIPVRVLAPQVTPITIGQVTGQVVSL